MIEEADLIITAEPQHRSKVVSLVPTAHRRTFTVLEFASVAARAVHGVDQRQARLDVVTSAGRRRSTETSQQSVPDPYGRSTKAHHRAVAAISAAAETIGSALTPVLPPSPEEAQ
jgi:protein-tyrosine phosphatase